MRIILILLMSVFFVSCKKERTIHISAKNAVTGLPYAGLNYYVVQEMTTNGGEKFKTVATGTLDANGEAAITKRLPKSYSYTIRVDEPPNTCYNKQISFSFGGEANFDCVFEFAECAYLKLHVHNTSCIDSNDQIQFRRLWLSTNGTNSYVIQPGCYQFDGDFFALPVGNYKYEWIVKKNGITTIYDSTFTLVENQYFDFTINY